MANSSSPSDLISSKSPYLQQFTSQIDFESITKRIPSFGDEFNVPEFLQLVARVDGTKEIDGCTEQLLAMAAMDDEDANPTPKFSKFAGLIPSPDLLRERKRKDATKEGKKHASTQQAGLEKSKKEAAFWIPLNDSTTHDVKGENIQGKENSAMAHDMAAIKTPLESMQGTKPLLSQCTDLVEFPLLSRETLTHGTKSKIARPAMAACMVQETRRADSKATNPLDCLPIKADSMVPKTDTLTKPGDKTESLIMGDDWADLEKDILSKCGANANKVSSTLADSMRDTCTHGLTHGLPHGINNGSNSNTSYEHEHIMIGNVQIAAPKSQDNSSAFLASKRTTLRYVKPDLIKGNVFVRPTWDIVQQGRKRWDHTAVGYFLGKKLPFMGVKNYVHSIWKGIVEVKATSTGFYFFKFDCEPNLLSVLEGGPWLYAGKPLFLERWKEGMTLEHKPHKEVPIWVKFRNLPTEYWTTDGLSTIASSIGTPLYPDAFTSSMERIDYARVCVLVSVNAKFHDHIYIMLPSESGEYNGTCKVGVEYEWRPLMCTKCHSFGHGINDCPLLTKVAQRSKPVQVYVPKATSDEEWQQQKKGKGLRKANSEGGESSIDSNPPTDHGRTTLELDHALSNEASPRQSNHIKGEGTSQRALVAGVERGKGTARRTIMTTKPALTAKTTHTNSTHNAFALLEDLEADGDNCQEADPPDTNQLILVQAQHT